MWTASARIGFGWGFRPVRQIEVIPSIGILSDTILKDGEQTNVDIATKANDILKYACFAFDPGVNIDLTVLYPVKLTGAVFYTLPFFSGEYWKNNDILLNSVGIRRLKGLTLRLGIAIEL